MDHNGFSNGPRVSLEWHTNSVVCVFIWQEAVASNQVRIGSLTRFTISDLKLHYLFRQDFLAANIASFFCILRSKDGGMLSAHQSMSWALWQWLGSGELGGEISRDGQAPAHPPQAWELELWALLHVAFLVAFFKSSLWAILNLLSARCPVTGLMLRYPSLAGAAHQSLRLSSLV